MSSSSWDTLIAGPAAGPLRGEITPPGDKSISHRILMLASLAEGETKVAGFLPGEDNLASVRIFEQMGIRIEWPDKGKTSLNIHGVGLHGLREPDDILDAGNSGTCARLMMGILAGQSFYSVITGDASLRTRPMHRVIEPMRLMGAVIDGRRNGELLPVAIRGGNLAAIHHDSTVASAQVKSCVLMAGLFARGETVVTEPRRSRDHTERMLPLFGQSVQVEGTTVRLVPEDALTAPKETVHVPADASSSSFFAIAANLVPDSRLRLNGVGVNPCRDGWRRIVEQMSGSITLEPKKSLGNEPVADMFASHAQLVGCSVNPADVVDAIDEFPVLFAAAALADGTFRLTAASELRVKESDRIATMATVLAACGVQVSQLPDGVCIKGRKRLHGGVSIDAKGDHRVAMAMAVAAQCADKDIKIRHARSIATSFPDFVPMAQRIGMNIHWLK